MANAVDECKSARLEGEFVNLDVQIQVFIVLTIPRNVYVIMNIILFQMFLSIVRKVYAITTTYLTLRRIKKLLLERDVMPSYG